MAQAPGLPGEPEAGAAPDAGHGAARHLPPTQDQMLGSGAQDIPYLLRGLTINRVNQVWLADITYIRILTGFMYLVAVMDWYSRYVLAWRLSTALDVDSRRKTWLMKM